VNDPEFIAKKVGAEKKSGGWRNNRPAQKGHLRRAQNPYGAFRHRCYWGRPTKVGWLVQLTFRCDLYDMPLSFLWNEKDLDGAKRYIDSLVAGRSSEYKFVEERGTATEHVYPTHDANLTPIRVQIHDFVDFLLMRGHIELPAHRRLLFITDKHRDTFIPSEFITVISQLPKLEFLKEHTEGWQALRSHDVEKAGLKSEEFNMGLGLEHPERTALALAPPEAVQEILPPAEAAEFIEPDASAAAVALPPPETEISRKAREKYFELITFVRPRDQQPYFTRRLATYGGQMLWAGTAYQMDGPWTEYLRENALLIGMGIEP
jgi:hypothetical protein